MAMNSGMMPSCVGTASVTTMNTNSPLRPLNRSFAKANPASEENSTVVSVTVPDTMTLLPSAFQNGTESNTREALAKKLPPGRNGGMRSVSIPLSAAGHQERPVEREQRAEDEDRQHDVRRLARLSERGDGPAESTLDSCHFFFTAGVRASRPVRKKFTSAMSTMITNSTQAIAEA